jgi:hypothetical protein
MDAKKARETLTRLCAEWDRAGQLMNRYIRPAGFSLALGVGVAASAGCSSSPTADALPQGVDAYGVTIFDGRVAIPDGAREAVPPAADVYGITGDGRVAILDSAREALPPAPDVYGVFDAPVPRDGGVDGPAVDALPGADAADGNSAEDAGDSGARD